MKRILFATVLTFALMGCEVSDPKSSNGLEKATANVKVQSNGLTVEQNNVKRRLEMENAPGAIQHLYVISAYSGDVILYSTVAGKVTSSGKRLTPSTVASSDDRSVGGIPISIGGHRLHTGEVLGDDGTYGAAIEYLYWWDTQGRYHQHYVTGGQIVEISSEPLAARHVIINLDKE